MDYKKIMEQAKELIKDNKEQEEQDPYSGVCSHCGSELENYNFYIRRLEDYYCSKSCWLAQNNYDTGEE